MFTRKWKTCKEFRKSLHQFLPKSELVIRHFSTTETLEPVKLSYASYENTAGDTSEKVAPLVIMHGLFGSKSNWNSLCKIYQQKTIPQRKIIAIDARNHGDSAHNNNHTYAHLAADIKALLEQLNVNKAALMGHSMGGRAVMLFALKYPELVDKLIVADISPITSTSQNLNSMPTIFRALETVHLPTEVSLSQARAEVDLQLSNTILEKSLRAFLLTNLVQRENGSYNWRINIPVLICNFNNISRFPLVNDLQYKGPVLFIAGEKSNYVNYGWRFNIKALLDNVHYIISFPEIHNITYDGPVLFLGGAKSDFIQKSDYPKILKLFPNAKLKYIDGAGHWLHSEKPAEFLKITLEFLNKKVQPEL